MFWLKFYFLKFRILITHIIKSCSAIKNVLYHVKNWVSSNINIIIDSFFCFLVSFLYSLRQSSDSKNNNSKLYNHIYNKKNWNLLYHYVTAQSRYFVTCLYVLESKASRITKTIKLMIWLKYWIQLSSFLNHIKFSQKKNSSK